MAGFKDSYFTLGMLPVPGIEDMTQPAWKAKGLWMQQFKIVRGLKSLESKVGLGPYLQQSLDNLEFYCGLALAQLDHRLGMSSSWEAAGEAGTIREITAAFKNEVPKAQKAWNQWRSAGGGVQAPKVAQKKPVKKVKPPALGMYGGFGSANPDVLEVDDSLLKSLSQPASMDRYWMKLGAAAGLLFLAYAIGGK